MVESIEHCKRDCSDETRKVRSVVIRVTKNRGKGKANSDGECKVIVGVNEVFLIPVVYAYCGFKTYKKIYSGLLDSEPPEDAVGYCTIGRGLDIGKKPADYNVIIVWVNNVEPFESALPIFMHEITHASYNIMKLVDVKDPTNEVQAYIVEREASRVMKEMYGMPVPKGKDSKVVEVLQNLKVCDVKVLGNEVVNV